MRQKIVIGCCAVPKRVRLPDGNSFVARYKIISRKNLPGNITVIKTRTVGPRNRGKERAKKKRVRFNLTNTPTQDRTRRIKKKRCRRLQSGRGPASTLANLGLKIGSKAINSVLRKKLIDKGIANIPNIVRYGSSKIKNKNVQRALDSDIANYIVKEAQNKAKNKLNNLFGGV